MAASAAATVYPASAQPPPPSNTSDAMKQFEELGRQAEKLNEEKLQAEEGLKAKRAESERASIDAGAAKQVEDQAKVIEDQFRGQVDTFSAASLNGARFSSMSALLTGDSQQDFLARASALKVLATDNNNALSVLTDAVDKAEQARLRFEQARRTADEGAAAAARLIEEIKQRQGALDGQIKEVRTALGRLTAAERAKLADVGDMGSFFGPPGAANTAVQAALAQRGKPYVYGATGPNTFDCSGLTMFAYKRAGVSLPRTSRDQFKIGKSVPRTALVPGDLLFYGDSAASIHHVAMYIGDGKIIHASTEGVPVKVTEVSGGGSDYLASKRIVG